MKQIADPQKRFRHAKSSERVPRIGQFKKGGAKRAVNLSIDETILADAKAMAINLSQLLEDELRKRVQDERNRRFQEEHREAIESHNKFIEKHGIWSEKFRSW